MSDEWSAVPSRDSLWGSPRPSSSATRPLIQLLEHPCVEDADMGFERRVDAAIGIDARVHAALGHLADLPILTVDQIPRLDSIGGIEVGQAHRLGIEEPVTEHAGAIRGQR